ncbi:MAG: hypothetical protein PHC84_05025, partial [Clostridia bacterium]|nr:hypothetical protein [Clostridia bacterium]
MTKGAKSFGLLIIITMVMALWLPLAATSLRTQKVAYAAGEYAISSWRQKNPLKYYYNATEGCAYIVSIIENANMPIQKISYSAYQVSMNTEDIERDDDDNIINPFVKDKQGNDLNSVEVTDVSYGESYDELGNRTVALEIIAYEWSAYLFTVEFKIGDESREEQGSFLYCTNIDNSKPYISLLGSPVFQDNGYYFEYMVRANEFGADRSANSGFKKIRTYRIINGEEQTVNEYTAFTNELTFYGGLLAIKGEYFIEATDFVGNRYSGRVVKIDKDLNKIITISAAEDYFDDEDDYAPALIASLREKYVAWQLMELDEDISEETLTVAYNDVLAALNACSIAQKLFTVKAINTEYVGSVNVENFDIGSYSSSVKGESVTMNISLAMFDTSEVDKSEILRLAELPEADKVLALNIYLTSNLQALTFAEYAAPVKITIPLSDYKSISAV